MSSNYNNIPPNGNQNTNQRPNGQQNQNSNQAAYGKQAQNFTQQPAQPVEQQQNAESRGECHTRISLSPTDKCSGSTGTSN
jgi:hypothetical protein